MARTGRLRKWDGFSISKRLRECIAKILLRQCQAPHTQSVGICIAEDGQTSRTLNVNRRAVHVEKTSSMRIHISKLGFSTRGLCRRVNTRSASCHDLGISCTHSNTPSNFCISVGLGGSSTLMPSTSSTITTRTPDRERKTALRFIHDLPSWWK